jgi:hypothetical protein
LAIGQTALSRYPCRDQGAARFTRARLGVEHNVVVTWLCSPEITKETVALGRQYRHRRSQLRLGALQRPTQAGLLAAGIEQQHLAPITCEQDTKILSQ